MSTTTRTREPAERVEPAGHVEPAAAAPAAVVTIRYWAAAKAATQVAAEERPPGRVEQVLAAARADHPRLESVLAVATVLLDGVPAKPDEPVPAGATLEVLPPFAGG